LDELLESIGIQRDQVFITNLVKDRPPGNRDPNQDEIAIYGPFLIRQINIIQPAVIATLGRIAMVFFLKYYNLEQKNQKIGELHGKILEAQAGYGVVKIVPLYHPAAAFYRQDLQNTMRDDFKVLKDDHYLHS
jgi:uracil-DNA glycosylase family 4